MSIMSNLRKWDWLAWLVFILANVAWIAAICLGTMIDKEAKP